MRAGHPQLLSAFALGILLAAAGKAREASELGPVSRSTIAISASVAPGIQVSGFHRIGAAELSSSTGPTRLDLCVVANTSMRSYSITAFGPSDGSGYFLVDAAGNRLPFALDWKSGAKSAELAPGIAAHGFSARARGCSDGEATGTSLTIKPRPESAHADTPSVQQAALTMLIAPE